MTKPSMTSDDSFARHKASVDGVGVGKIIEPSEAKNRDAIHIAVAPVTAGELLRPGQHIGIEADLAVASADPIGIVDPFLQKPVKVGQRFWLFLDPGSITSLRHEWTHPSFLSQAEKDAAKNAVQFLTGFSEEWLRNFTNTADCPGYDTVMAAARAHVAGNNGFSDEYLHFDGTDAHGEIPPEFWEHFERVTRIKVPQRLKAQYFSCSC